MHEASFGRRIRRAAIASVFLACSALMHGRAVVGEPVAFPTDPAREVIETSDIDRFWSAIDASTETNRAAVLQTQYLDRGSAGVQAFIPHRIQSAKHLAEVYTRGAHYYAAVRRSTLRVRDQIPAIRRATAELGRLIDGAVFPPIYFLIGALNSGGTSSDAGLMIGTELEALPADRDPLACAGYERTCAVAEPVERLPFIVAHELTHFEQDVVRGNAPQAPDTVLHQALVEGVADYVGSRASQLPVGSPYMDYGRGHGAEVRTAFLADRASTDLSEWFYGKPKHHADWPNDMGYYVGYTIAESYLDRHRTDRKAALRRLLAANDPEAILTASGYANGVR